MKMRGLLFIVFHVLFNNMFAQTMSKEKKYFDELFKKVSNEGKWEKMIKGHGKLY